MRFVIVLALIWGTAEPAAGELWCGDGPGAPLDHPCAADNARFDRVFAAHGRELAEWRRIPGVTSMGYGMSQRGFFPEIQVWVEDAATVALVRPKIPTSIEGIAVAVILPLRGETGGPTSANCPADTSGGRYLRALKKVMDDTIHMPGALEAGPARCENGCCYYDRIGVRTQVPFLNAVRAKIPREVDGIPVDVIPFQWPPRE